MRDYLVALYQQNTQMDGQVFFAYFKYSYLIINCLHFCPQMAKTGAIVPTRIGRLLVSFKCIILCPNRLELN